MPQKSGKALETVELGGKEEEEEWASWVKMTENSTSQPSNCQRIKRTSKRTREGRLKHEKKKEN